MNKTITLIFTIFALLSCSVAFAEEEKAPSPLTSDKFTVYIDIPLQKGNILPSVLELDLKTEDGELISSGQVSVTKAEPLKIEFSLPLYAIGTKFSITMQEGAQHIVYYTDTFGPGEPFLAETYAFLDERGNLVVADSVHISMTPLLEPWKTVAERFIKDHNYTSKTDYLIWVSKNNFTVSVFLKRDFGWELIRQIPCSIGADSTPTVTGEFTYHQYQNKWIYDGYYVGPVMRFYKGYAIHSTLVNNNGTNRDARLGKRISHGCVRVLPDAAKWLTDYVPLGTKIYVTEE